MKNKIILKILVAAILIQFARIQAVAQLNCDGQTNMYGIFIDKNRSNGNTYISPIDYITGTIGTALAPGVFTVPVASSTAGGNAYGSTTLAAQPITHRLFYMTGDYNAKDIWGFSALTPGTKVKISDDLGTAVNGHWFVKMAMAEDGYGYSLSTKRTSPLSDTVNGNTKLIRFNSCMTANCATVSVMAVIPKANFDPFELYNGDIAFDAKGDMYIFGSKFDPVNNDYVKAGIFRINKADIPTTPGTTNIPITRLGDMPALDSLSITGVAFDANGNFYLAAVDTVTGQRNRSHIFRGSVIGPTTPVTKLFMGIIPNYVISDLASCTYPTMILLDAATAKLNGFNRGNYNSLVWKVDGINNVRNFIVERQLHLENDFKPIAAVKASDSYAEYHYDDKEQQPVMAASSYRIRFEKKDGSIIYSNTIQLQVQDRSKTKVTVTGNPFKESLQFDLSTLTPGVKNVIIYDSNGFSVLSEKLEVSAGINKITLKKTRSFRKGIYVLHVFDESNSQQFKVIKN